MNRRPVVIVDPRSSGVELAPAFRSRGIPVIAITFEPLSHRLGFGTKVQISDFDKIIPVQENLKELLRDFHPIAIIPGAEKGVPLADQLAEELTPEFANDPQKGIHRRHKAYMQKALEESNIPFLKTLNATSVNEVDNWIKRSELMDSPLIIKPPISAGSDKVFHVSAYGDWKAAFSQVFNRPSNITGERNKTVIVQEQAIGVEYAVGTVSANGKHSLTHIIKYNKLSMNSRKTIFDYVEFVPYNEDKFGELFDYAKKVLNALGIRWGAAHTEIMLTREGPRLIETGARMLGGPTIEFAREATGSSQVDRLVEAYLDESSYQAKTYEFMKTVMPVFLKSPAHGVVLNSEVFNDIANLPTLLNQFLWFKNGEVVPQTNDYLTSIGIIALSGERKKILLDYKKIRQMESQLKVQPL